MIGELAVAENDETELGSPVAQMIVGDDVVAERAVESVDGVADDGRANVTDMHRLGDVRAGVVDDDGLLFSKVRKSKIVAGDHSFELIDEALVFQEDVNEAGASEFDLFNEVGQRCVIDELLADRTWVGAQGFGEFHGRFTLVIAELFVFAGCDREIDFAEVGIG